MNESQKSTVIQGNHDDGGKPLTPPLTPNDLELAKIVSALSKLPENLRRGFLAMFEAAK